MTLDDLLAAWRVNDSINHELLDLCPDETFDLKPGGGKTIRSNFVHIVGVRRSHLEEKMPREAAAVPKLDWKSASREEIREALGLSRDLTAILLEKIDTSEKPGRWTAPLFLAYSVAHEAHHRSQIEIALRTAGRMHEDLVMYRLWEWPKKARQP